ncbi:MAG: hypothetical protein PHC51_13425 [bacterium]|nr:hypothetical protein [bacterium]
MLKDLFKDFFGSRNPNESPMKAELRRQEMRKKAEAKRKEKQEEKKRRRKIVTQMMRELEDPDRLGRGETDHVRADLQYSVQGDIDYNQYDRSRIRGGDGKKGSATNRGLRGGKSYSTNDSGGGGATSTLSKGSALGGGTKSYSANTCASPTTAGSAIKSKLRR